MTYYEFIEGIKQYVELFNKGLKKRANKELFDFMDNFRETVPENEADEILNKFCGDYFDENKLNWGDSRGVGGTWEIPFQLRKLLGEHFSRCGNFDKMPQMRWCFETFGNYYDPERCSNFKDFNMLEKIYRRTDRDQKSVNYYFNEQIEILYWGSHHFPEGCIITRDTYYNTVNTAEAILSENVIPENMIEEFEYYKKLYECFFDWEDGGRKGDFGRQCEKAGIDEFNPMITVYYNN